MYLRHTTRRKDGKVHRYWQLVRSVRVGRKVVQQTVAHLGELDAQGRARQGTRTSDYERPRPARPVHRGRRGRGHPGPAEADSAGAWADVRRCVARLDALARVAAR